MTIILVIVASFNLFLFLCFGDARAEVEWVGKIADNNRRYRLILLRSQAVLVQWDGDGLRAGYLTAVSVQSILELSTF